MQSPNPYRPPRTELRVEPDFVPGIFVEGPCLVVASGTELPRRCIKTNQPVGEHDFARQRLTWRGRSFQLVLSEKECRLTWYAVPSVRRRLTYIKVTQFAGPACAILPVFLIDTIGGWSVIPVLLALCMMSYSVFAKPPLRVVRYQRERFWIEGCSGEFLRSLEEALRGDASRESP